jgi:hypothetical protein
MLIEAKRSFAYLLFIFAKPEGLKLHSGFGKELAEKFIILEPHYLYGNYHPFKHNNHHIAENHDED